MITGMFDLLCELKATGNKKVQKALVIPPQAEGRSERDEFWTAVGVVRTLRCATPKQHKNIFQAPKATVLELCAELIPDLEKPTCNGSLTGLNNPVHEAPGQRFYP